MKTKPSKVICVALVVMVLFAVFAFAACNKLKKPSNSDTPPPAQSTESTKKDPDGYIALPEDVFNSSSSLETETTNPVEPVVKVEPGLYKTGTNELIYNWSTLIEKKFISVKQMAITDVSERLTGDLYIHSGIISISKKAFNGCTGISAVYCGGEMTYVGESAFLNCSGLQTVNLGGNVTKIDSYAFKNCTGLENLTIGENVTSIEVGAFYACTSLREIIIPDKVSFVGKNAFYSCTGAKVVYIGKNVTLISESAFNGCTGVEEIVLPKGVSYIGVKAFYNCNSLKTVNYEGTAEDFAAITLGTNNTRLTGAEFDYAVNMFTIKESIINSIKKPSTSEENTGSSES